MQDPIQSDPRKPAPAPRTLRTEPKPEPSMTEKAAQAVHRAVDQVAEKAAGAEEKLRRQAAEKSDQASATSEEIKAKAQETLASAESYARQNPLAAAGIAFAAGVLASVILRR